MLSRQLFVVCGVAFATVAQADWLTISPVIIEIATASKPVAVRVTNDSDREATFQLDTSAWQQLNGKDVYAASEDLILAPSILVIPPRKSQTFRVLLRDGRPSPVERTYRVIVEDITEASKQTDPISTTTVSFKFTHNLPVLVAPSGKIVNAMRWQACATGATGRNRLSSAPDPSMKATNTANNLPAVLPDAETCVRLLNSGNRRIKVLSLTLAGDGWQQSLALKAGENVLVGAEREWRIPLLPGQLNAVRGVLVETAESGTLAAEAGGF